MNKISEKEDEINPNFPKEWEVSRSLLSFFDDKLYDLRKYGFSFITALITAEGLLITYVDPTKNWPVDVKFAVLFVNILLIVALTTIDRNFSVIQKAGASRARVLERTMNLELSEVITQRYKGARLDYFATGLYTVFIVAVMFLAGVILHYSGIYYWVLIVTGLIAIFVSIAIRQYVKVEYPYGEIDWTIDRLRCTQGDIIGITLTNLREDRSTKDRLSRLVDKLRKTDLKEDKMTFNPSDDGQAKVMWEVRKEGETKDAAEGLGTLKQTIEIDPGESYTWLWPTDECHGVYRVYRFTLTRKKLVPLKRKIIIKEKPKKTIPEPTLVKLVKNNEQKTGQQM